MSGTRVVAAVCRACGRELKRDRQDNDEAAFKRAKWGQMWDRTKPLSGVCRACRKKGRG